MQKEIELIQRYAKELKKLEDNEHELFSYLNNIAKPEIEGFINDLSFVRSDSTTQFQPVNVLRFDILNLLKKGIRVNSETVDNVKNKIIEKDIEYFSKYGDTLVNALKNYPQKKKSPFVNWQQNFYIFFPFVYTNTKKAETRSTLNKVVTELKEALKLNDYKSHIVDFTGPQSFGVSYCWMALYPKNIDSHRKAYQLFIRINADTIEAGILAGWDINDKKSDTVEEFNTIDEVIEKLEVSKQTADDKNNTLIGLLRDIESEHNNSPSPEVPQKNSESQNFWWLNANPKIWSIDSFQVGDIQTYTSHNKNGNKRRIYKYFEEVKPSDLVIGYESHPTKQVKAIYEITEGLHVDDEGEIISFEIKEKVKEPISWDELKETKGLENSEVLNNNQGSLFKLTAEEFKLIKDLIDGKNPTNEKKTKDIKIKPYSFSDDPDKPFLEEHEIKGIIESLEVKKNIVLQGPPGVGKTFIAKKIAYEMMKKIDDSKIKMVQFHQSYSYEDFIQGIRPSEDSSRFKVKNGIFFDFCIRAAAEPSQKFFFIIDEINRGNLSKIFGELMMLIESDKRGKYTLPLTYSEKDDPEFSVPENLYLIGTMNTADRSLAIVDYALRRRFRFITLEPKFNERFEDFLSSKGFKKDFIEKITFKINSLNEKIEEDKNLGRGFLIGHSFFCGAKRGTEREWFDNIVKFEIKPLLEEYWFDDSEKVEKEINLLLS